MENDLRNVLRFFSEHISNLACDFGISPEFVDEQTRMFGAEIVNKIKKTVGLDFMNCYEPGYFMKLVKQCGFENARRFTMTDIQMERTGKKAPFEGTKSGWVTLVKS